MFANVSAVQVFMFCYVKTTSNYKRVYPHRMCQFIHALTMSIQVPPPSLIPAILRAKSSLECRAGMLHPMIELNLF